MKQLSDVNNAVVLICNQVMSKPDALWGDPTKAVGGHIISHASAFRIYLRKAKAGRSFQTCDICRSDKRVVYA